MSVLADGCGSELKHFQPGSEPEFWRRANYYLGNSYEQGVGTKRNLKKAWLTYKVAAEHDIFGADEAFKRIQRLLREERS